MKKRIIQLVLLLMLFSGIAVAGEGHDHGPGTPAGVQWGLQGLNQLVNIHPLFVHFPIALLLVSSAFYLSGLVLRKEELLSVGKWSLFSGTLSAMVAVGTGLQAANTVPHGGGVHETLIAHQYTGYSILGVSLLLSLWLLLAKRNLPQKGKALFFTVLFILSVVVLQQADFGGRLVFLHGVGVRQSGAEQQSELRKESGRPTSGEQTTEQEGHSGHSH